MTSIINKYLGLLFLIFFSRGCFAQDTIFMTNASVEIVNIEQVMQTQIQYKKYLIPQGALYIVNKMEVHKIKYKDGRTEVYADIKIDDPSKPRGNITSIDYGMVKRNYNKLPNLIDDRISLKNKEQLYKQADVLGRLSQHQQATRTGIVTFGCFVAASLIVLGFDYIINVGNPQPEFFIPPVGFVLFTTAFTATHIGISSKLKKKRQTFVKLFND